MLRVDNYEAEARIYPECLKVSFVVTVFFVLNLILCQLIKDWGSLDSS